VAHRVCGRLEEIVGRTPLRPTSPAPPKAKAERRRRAAGQTSPPETTRFAPVVYDASSLSKKATVRTTSEEEPSRRIGTEDSLAAPTCAGSRAKKGEPDAACRLFCLGTVRDRSRTGLGKV